MKHKLLKLSLLALFTSGASTFADPASTLMFVDSLGRISQFAQPKDGAPAPAPGTCDWKASRSACTNGTDSFAFNGCSVDQGKVLLTGGFDEAFTGTGSDTCQNPLANGETVSHTSKGLTATFAAGETATTDTMGGTAYDGTVVPATGSTVVHMNDISTVTVNGSHMITRDKTGVMNSESFAFTTAGIDVAGLPGDGSLVVTDGAFRIFHQMDKSTSDVNIVKVAWSDKTCCHPVSGTITEVMSGAKTGTRSLTFTATCGAATVVDVDGTSSTVNLPACAQ